MAVDYQSIKITTERAKKILSEYFGIEGKLKALPGELDFNFRVICEDQQYLLKISRPNPNVSEIEFQNAMLEYLTGQLDTSIPLKNLNGQLITHYPAEEGERIVRLMSWVEGKLWSGINPVSLSFLNSLGKSAGELNQLLYPFEHPFADRYLEWDIQHALWCKEKIGLLGEGAETVQYFLDLFEFHQEEYKKLRSSIIHSDVNDNNVICKWGDDSYVTSAIIDFGDAVYSKTINDLAICVAYGIMHKPDPLEAAVVMVKGYHSEFKLLEEELELLYVLVAMRLTITVTKAAMNKIAEPENEYHQISAIPAWGALAAWRGVHPKLATEAFKAACNVYLEPVLLPNSKSVNVLFPNGDFRHFTNLDLSVGSHFLGTVDEWTDKDLFEFKLNRLTNSGESNLVYGGYQEYRMVYSTENYELEGNETGRARTGHLGVDFWLPSSTPVGAFSDGVVVCVHDNDIDKDYGPTVIVKHNQGAYFTLYGHLSKETLEMVSVGQSISEGEILGTLGDSSENGGWVPHLHFQIMTDLLGNETNFPGVACPNEMEAWKRICPDPCSFLKELSSAKIEENEALLRFRKEHLGKSLSLSYKEPLHIVRGDGQYLIDSKGRRYLDTVNNVAHVGHENPSVVRDLKNQAALLNTNTRYLNQKINQFAEELLKTMPNELSVVHFVNSGSEANELAMRMAKTYSGEKDMVAVEIGYHGNAGACIDVSSYKFDGKGGEGAPEYTQIIPLPDRFRGIHRGGEASKYASYIDEAIGAINAKGRGVAGFICESIISCGGQVELPDGYLSYIYDKVRKAGGLCIADEVQVGMGRIGSHWWGFELHGVVPDIVTIGKPLGNGHPLAAVVCTQEVAERFANGMEYFNTFGGNPVSSAVGLAVLKEVNENNLRSHAEKMGARIKGLLSELSREFPIIQDVRGQGLFLGFELVDDGLNPLPAKASYLANRMKEKGVLMSTDGKDNNAIKIKPPMVIQESDVLSMFEKIRDVLQEDFMQKKDLA